MRKNIADITPVAGWEKSITNNNLVIKKVVEFDLFTFMETPFFAAPIEIEKDQTLTVGLSQFVAYGTEEIIDNVIEVA